LAWDLAVSGQGVTCQFRACVVEKSRTTGQLDSHGLALDLTLVDHGVFVPSECPRNLLSLLPLRTLALDNLGDPSGGDRLSLQDGRGVQPTGIGIPVHPRPLSRIIGQVSGLDEDLAVFEFGEVLGLEGKGGRGDGAGRRLGEGPDAGGGRGG
jgi:hypothetical protein